MPEEVHIDLSVSMDREIRQRDSPAGTFAIVSIGAVTQVRELQGGSCKQSCVCVRYD
jgi:hypothetical protein